MAGNQSEHGEGSGRVVRLAAWSNLRKTRKVPNAHKAVNRNPGLGDLSQFERGSDTDDYRRRMVVNAIAFGFIVMLTLAGLWIAETMALLRKNQDCALAGRTNCIEIGAAAASTDRK